MNLILLLKQLRKVNPWKTLYFNFHYFPLKIAIRIPIFIYWRTFLYKMSGRIIIDAPLSTGMVKLGQHGLGTQDPYFSRTMWESDGIVIIKGKTFIGRGTKISVGKNATLTLGENFTTTGNSEIVCKKEIGFGNDCLLSWDILIMDTDFHNILDENGQIINEPKPIVIGNHVWIGCRNTILKGVSIADNIIISANSTITRSVEESNCIFGGHGKSAEIIKHNIDWKL